MYKYRKYSTESTETKADLEADTVAGTGTVAATEAGTITVTNTDTGTITDTDTGPGTVTVAVAVTVTVTGRDTGTCTGTPFPSYNEHRTIRKELLHDNKRELAYFDKLNVQRSQCHVSPTGRKALRVVKKLIQAQLSGIKYDSLKAVKCLVV